MSKQINISDSEWKVMQVLWAAEDKPLTLGEIVHELEGEVEWKKRTIQTLVQRLQKKGVISYVEGRFYKYYANVTEDKCLKSEMRSILAKLFYSSPSKLISTLVDTEEFTENDKEAILSILKGIEERHNND